MKNRIEGPEHKLYDVVYWVTQWMKFMLKKHLGMVNAVIMTAFITWGVWFVLKAIYFLEKVLAWTV